MRDLEVLATPARAVAVLDPTRARLLSELTEPASAAMLAERVALTRQRITYHLRTLAGLGLVEEAGQRRWGGLTERMYVASAASYAIASGALGVVGSDPARASDRLSEQYLVAVAARVVDEVAALSRQAGAGQVPTLTIDTEIDLPDAGARAAFAQDLAAAVNVVVARHHDPSTPATTGGRHRLIVAAHPMGAEKERTDA